VTESRKLAAIMAVDVVGYSRLMGEDEAGLAKAVREHRKASAPIVADFGGRVVKTMGHGVLLEFPSVVAAVECAVTIQNVMVERNVDTPEARRIVYRIGVHLGADRRRRYFGRWGQHRGAAEEHLRARRRLNIPGRL
jgi:class 3 adenylate cyclase